ncbi:hypothetical protein D0T12_25545 [Actinomadura spongiicola]|uniref:Uncharacterized protein n=1 Tax=Actinomadura spongiicola TaxID=2303421 RepID=A0A372GBL2_9ACTN|nr:hypothetical protein [Actinomadura spongiicola]RFS82796.1 hypothetical protein D0T12_25545 [Actinomadura spongiicola]
MYCSTCGDEREFEQPPCPDGHGEECPERACVECGAAVLVGSPPAAPAAAASGPVPGPPAPAATVRAVA